MPSKFRLNCEYYAAKVGLGLVNRLSPKMACAGARMVGNFAYCVCAKRRRTAIDNLLKTGVAKNRAEAKSIAKSSFQSIALTMVESILVPRMLADGRMDDSAFDISMPDETHKLFTQDIGIITVSGHLGNWELGAKVVSKYKPITAIARPMNNHKVQELMDAVQIRDGFETIDKHDSAPIKIVRALKKKRILALLTDQHAHGPGSCIVDFFGMPAVTYASPAILQHMTGAPIILCFVTRTGLFKFHFEFSKPLFFEIKKETMDGDIQRATQYIASELEARIRQNPRQYLWMHRRWKKLENKES